MGQAGQWLPYVNQEGMMMTNCDETIVAVNEVALAVMGCRKEQVIGQSVGFLLTKANDVSLYGSIWEEVWQRGYWQGLVRLRAGHDGRFLKRLTVQALPSHDKRNQLFVWLFGDTLEEPISMPVVIVREDLAIKHWNGMAESLFGWKQDEMIGQSLFSLVPHHLFDLTRFAQQAATDRFFDWEGEWRTKNETMVPAACSMAALVDRSGGIDGYVLVIQDKTKAKKTERFYQKQQELTKKLQQGILTPSIENQEITIKASYIPSEPLSGDVYACYQIDDVRFGIVMIDVMDHCFSPFLITFLRSLLRELILRVVDPICVAMELEKHTQRLFAEFSSQTPFLFSMIYAVIDIRNRNIEYTNAGHLPGLLLTNRGDMIELNKGGLGIGSPFAHSFQKEVVRYEKCARLFLYTDGLLGEIDSSPWRSVAKVRNDVKVYQHLSDEQFLSTMLDKYVHTRRPADDVCILSLTLEGAD